VGNDDEIRLLGISAAPLDVAAVYDVVQARPAGAVAVFVGVVRDHDNGKRVTSLDYSAHPSAIDRLREVANGVVEEFEVIALAAVHRTGHLEVGDTAVIVAVSAAHRGQAYDASRALIDRLKATVPVWKHQVFADGQEEWVNSP